MGTKRFVDVVCRDLRRFIDVRDVPMGDLGWGLSGTRVSSRLKHRDPPPNLDHVDATLETLGIDLDEFLVGLATGFHPELVLAPYLDEHPRQFPRFRRRRLRQPPKRDYSVAEIHELADGLESLRFRDVDRAFRQALEILRFGAAGGAVEPDDGAETWGVLGVIQRQRGKTATTAGAYLEAFKLAEAPAVRARTFQRIGMLLHLSGGDQDGALRAVLGARRIYLDAGDDSGVGKTFVDEAAITCLCGNHRRTRALSRRALRYLAETEVENRFAAVQVIAIASVFLDETDEAATFLHQATATLPGDRPLLSCSLYWLRGELSLALGQSLEAGDSPERRGDPMTCVVGFSDGNTIIFGADSAATGGGPETSAAGEIYTAAEPKVFARGAYLLGVCGSYRVAQILRYRAELPEMPAATEDVEGFLVRDLLPAIAGTIAAAGIAGTKPGYLGDRVALLLGLRGQLWTVCSDLTLVPESGFGAVGSGRHRAYGALYALETAGVERPRRRVEIALEAAAAYTSDVRPPWHFVNSEDRLLQWSTDAGSYSR